MPHNRRILCIENDKDSCDLLETLFSFEGFEFTCCDTADEALRLARNNTYSAIVLEYRLAAVKGTELCREIRDFDRETPIVFYSASAFPAERRAGFAAGADDYLVKPNDFERLTDVVTALAKTTGRSIKSRSIRPATSTGAADTAGSLNLGGLPAAAGCAAGVVSSVSILGH